MNKKLNTFATTVLLSFLITGHSYPQFTITSIYNPCVGDSTVSRYVDTTGIAPGEAGANRIWNFANLIISGETSIEYFLSPSATPYYYLFPNSNMASIHLFNSIPTTHYFYISDTGFVQLGWVDPQTIARFPNPFPRNLYPAYYGSQHINNYNFTITSENITEYIWGIKTQSCDGYGTIILPSGTYNNTLRIKTIDDEADTIRIGGVVISIYHNITTNYFWYVQGYKFPVFVLSYAAYQNGYYKNAAYCLVNEPVGVKRITSDVPKNYYLYQNFPNPFNPSTIIRFRLKESGFVSLKIYDILGRETAILVNEKLQAGKYEIPYSVNLNNNLSGGVYFYRLEAGNYVQTRKMILLK
jgi:hypothetical protein